jgi:L-fuculose-phosphate aldolase
VLYLQERQAVVDACRFLQEKHLVVGTAGNISIRRDDEIIISPSAVEYSQMTVMDIVVVDMKGNIVEGKLKPSSELPFHISIYSSTEHQAIVHTHAPASTALSVVVDEIPLTHYYSALFGGAIQVAPYALYGSDELAVHIAKALKGRTAALLANHGAVTVGADIRSALGLVEYLEYLCDVELRVLATGKEAKVITPAELDQVIAKLDTYKQ